MHTLLFLEPGHFHAALTLRVANPRIDPVIHLYARPGPERDAFIALVRSFNDRADEPTGWDVRVHEAADPERALVEERLGDVVVLAGRNRPKLGAIARLHAAGLHVLADKPWLTDGAALPDLERATAGWPLAMDIMTFRHEVVAGLAQKIAADPELSGALDAQAGEPAIDIQSVHHLLKVVNGAPLRRPAWYYDTRIQGDGLVDIQSHMADQAQWILGDGPGFSFERDYELEDARRWSTRVPRELFRASTGLVDIQSHMADQAQWILGDGPGFSFERDYELEDARRWSTPVPRQLFRASTGLDDFPEALAPQLEAGVLRLACNGEIRYRLRGAPVRQRAEWGQREPEGGGDAHRTTVRGERATVIARRGPETGFRGELHVAPREPGPGFEARLSERLAAWEGEFPGLSHRPSPLGREIVIPAALHTPHEAHFAMVLDDFLDRLDAGEWPAALAARIRARYTLLARARERCAA